MKIISRFFIIIAVLLMIGSTSFANMKKSSIGDGKQKTYVFNTTQDGPCSATVIFDNNTADLDTGLGDGNSGDLLCIGVSTQKNYDACIAGLPPGDYFLAIASFKGASNFRTLVNCGSQETIQAGRQSSSEVVLKEFEGNSQSRKFIDQLKKISSRKK